MKVSIVTLSFNQGAYLRRAILSVLSQDYPEIEYIVVDPGSTDCSRDIIDAFSDRISHIVLDPDRGPADGLNHGFEIASGDVLAYVNADDAMLPRAVSEAVACLEESEDVDVVYGDGYLVDHHGCVIRPIESSPFSLRRYSYGHVTILQPATFIRKSSFDAVGGFNPSNPVSWDGELVVDIALNGGTLRHVPRKWAAWAMYPETISGSARYAAQWRLEMDRLFRRIHGRSPRPVDVPIGAVTRLERWLVSPQTTWRRSAGVLQGRPRKALVDDGSRVEIVAVDRPCPDRAS